MKKIYFTLLMLIIASSSLVARDNPFEPTQAFKDELERMLEIEEVPEEFQQKDPSHYEKMSKDKPKTIPVPKVAPKKIDSIKKPKINEKLVYVPLREKPYVNKAEISLLPGVEIAFEGKKLEIKSKYEVFQKFDIGSQGKIVLDFRADLSFNTIRKDLGSQYFSKLTAGNHKKNKFFRIAIEVPASTKDYRVTYDKDLVTIVFEESGLKQP